MDGRTDASDGARHIAEHDGRGIEFRPLRPEHAAIYPRLREQDHIEMAATSRLDPALQIAYSIAASRIGYAAYADGVLSAIFGATDGPGGVGVPWLLATDELARRWVPFVKLSKGFIDEMKGAYDVLENHAHVGNLASIRWLKRNGFTFDEPVGELVRFWWKR